MVPKPDFGKWARTAASKPTAHNAVATKRTQRKTSGTTATVTAALIPALARTGSTATALAIAGSQLM